MASPTADVSVRWPGRRRRHRRNPAARTWQRRYTGLCPPGARPRPRRDRRGLGRCPSAPLATRATACWSLWSATVVGYAVVSPATDPVRPGVRRRAAGALVDPATRGQGHAPGCFAVRGRRTPCGRPLHPRRRWTVADADDLRRFLPTPAGAPDSARRRSSSLDGTGVTTVKQVRLRTGPVAATGDPVHPRGT